MSALAFISAPSSAPDPAWMSKQDILQLTGLTARWFEICIKESGNSGRPAVSRIVGTERNGRPIREFHIDTLPPPIRTKLTAPSAPLSIVPATPLFPQPAPASEPMRVSLAPDAEREANRKLDLIRPLLNYKTEREKYLKLKLSDGRAITTANLLAEYIAETSANGTRTLWRWVKAYRKGGIHALARKPREDQGRSHFFARNPAAAQLVAAEYLKPYATVQRAYDALVRDRELLRIAEDDLPTYGTVLRYLDSLPAPAKILAREGLRRYNETCAPHLARGYTDIPANSIWVADHMIHDCEVANDCFPSLPENAPMRLRLTCIMDLRSRKIVGFCWAVEGDSRAIVTALRRAIASYGPPEIFYCDNGNDFKKVARGAQRMRPTEAAIRMAAEQAERCGALQQVGAKVQFCLPYHAQSKPVERTFGFVHGRLDGIMHTYLTGNAYNRPDAATLAGAHHRRVVKQGRAHESTLMPASFFIKLAETWIEQDYNAQHLHSGKGMNKRTPNAVFEEGYPVEKRRPIDPQVLALMLYERRTVKVIRTAVTVDKRRYMPVPASPESWAAVNENNGRMIVVAFDPLDPQRMVALNGKDQIIAELQPEELAAHPTQPDAATTQQIAAMSQIRGRLLKANSIYVATMHQGVALAGHKSAIEHLADRAKATIPVDHLLSQRVIRKATRPSDTSRAPKSSFDIAASLLEELA